MVPAGIVCHAFEAFSSGCILLELFSSYKLFFRVTEFSRLLMFSRFYPHFKNLRIRSDDISQVLTFQHNEEEQSY